MEDHWARFGRNYYSRHDYEGVDADAAGSLMSGLRAALAGLPGMKFGKLEVSAADDFAYVDPVDASVSDNQGLRISFADGSRIVFRLSGTGTEGATLRVYLERYEDRDGHLDAATTDMLAPLARAACKIAGIESHTGRAAPDVVA